MNSNQDYPDPALDDAILLELADELHRLAAGLRRDLKRSAVLPCLSDLTAMQPLQSMLIDALSSRVSKAAKRPAQLSVGEEIIPGYL